MLAKNTRHLKTKYNGAEAGDLIDRPIDSEYKTKQVIVSRAFLRGMHWLKIRAFDFFKGSGLGCVLRIFGA